MRSGPWDKPTRRPRATPSRVKVVKSLWDLGLSKDPANPERLAICSEACKGAKVTKREARRLTRLPLVSRPRPHPPVHHPLAEPPATCKAQAALQLFGNLDRCPQKGHCHPAFFLLLGEGVGTDPAELAML